MVDIPALDEIAAAVVSFLNGDFYLSGELQAFFMALQGSMVVRMGANKNHDMAWFHAFALSIITGYGGGWFGNVLMAKPTPFFANDVNMAMCIISFLIVNYTPYDIGFKICKTFPVVIVTTSFAQLFRSLGVCKFTTIAYDAFKDKPSPYYPIPVFGPILNGTLLSNMGAFFLKGFNPHLEHGMPWPFQNGIFCSSFYNFYVHDVDGPIGKYLRLAVGYCTIPGVSDILGLDKIDDKTFATAFVGLFMQVIGILQLSYFLGPFSPFVKIQNIFESLFIRYYSVIDEKAAEKVATKSKRRRIRKRKEKGKGGVVHNSVSYTFDGAKRDDLDEIDDEIKKEEEEGSKKETKKEL